MYDKQRTFLILVNRLNGIGGIGSFKELDPKQIALIINNILHLMIADEIFFLAMQIHIMQGHISIHKRIHTHTQYIPRSAEELSLH